MKLIGIEEHFLTAEIRDAWRAVGLDATDPSVAFHSGTIEGRLLDLAQDRLALMDETGLDVQVLSLTTPALHDLGPESVDLAKRSNDALAEVVSRHPARFQAMATKRAGRGGSRTGALRQDARLQRDGIIRKSGPTESR